MDWTHIINTVVGNLNKKSEYAEKCSRDLRLITDAIQNDLDNPMLNGAFTKRAG